MVLKIIPKNNNYSKKKPVKYRNGTKIVLMYYPKEIYLIQ